MRKARWLRCLLASSLPFFSSRALVYWLNSQSEWSDGPTDWQATTPIQHVESVITKPMRTNFSRRCGTHWEDLVGRRTKTARRPTVGLVCSRLKTKLIIRNQLLISTSCLHYSNLLHTAIQEFRSHFRTADRSGTWLIGSLLHCHKKYIICTTLSILSNLVIACSKGCIMCPHSHILFVHIKPPHEYYVRVIFPSLLSLSNQIHTQYDTQTVICLPFKLRSVSFRLCSARQSEWRRVKLQGSLRAWGSRVT